MNERDEREVESAREILVRDGAKGKKERGNGSEKE